MIQNQFLITIINIRVLKKGKKNLYNLYCGILHHFYNIVAGLLYLYFNVADIPIKLRASRKVWCGSKANNVIKNCTGDRLYCWIIYWFIMVVN